MILLSEATTAAFVRVGWVPRHHFANLIHHLVLDLTEFNVLQSTLSAGSPLMLLFSRRFSYWV